MNVPTVLKGNCSFIVNIRLYDQEKLEICLVFMAWPPEGTFYMSFFQRIFLVGRRLYKEVNLICFIKKKEKNVSWLVCLVCWDRLPTKLE